MTYEKDIRTVDKNIDKAAEHYWPAEAEYLPCQFVIFPWIEKIYFSDKQIKCYAKNSNWGYQKSNAYIKKTETVEKKEQSEYDHQKIQKKIFKQGSVFHQWKPFKNRYAYSKQCTKRESHCKRDNHPGQGRHFKKWGDIISKQNNQKRNNYWWD